MTIEAMKAFCKERIPDRDWEKGEFQVYGNKIMEQGLEKVKKLDGVGVRDCKVIFSPEEPEYQYVASFCVVHDGTLMFVVDAIKTVIYRLMYGFTYFRPMGYNCIEDTVRYFIGNMMVLNEYGKFLQEGEECPDTMLYPSTRTTVMIPVRMERDERKDDVDYHMMSCAEWTRVVEAIDEYGRETK